VPSSTGQYFLRDLHKGGVNANAEARRVPPRVLIMADYGSGVVPSLKSIGGGGGSGGGGSTPSNISR
jgi:hypothetical protein